MQMMAKAERLLAEGKYAEAHTLVVEHTFLGSQQLRTRGTVVNATALFRLPASKTDRYVVLQGHLRYLEYELGEDPGNAVIVARLAEGYANYEDSREQARTLLEDLAKRDLMPDAFGYATLAQLRAGSGDVTGAKVALRKCREMDRRKNLCSLTPQHAMPYRALDRGLDLDTRPNAFDGAIQLRQ